MKQKIVIPGGNGFIGQYLSDYFAKRDFSVIILSRKPGKSKPNIEQCHWDGKTQGPWSKHLEGAKAVINLSGKSVNCRYHEKNKRAILDSRIDSTLVIAAAIDHCENPPEVWINAASATIYRHTTSGVPNDEINGKTGEGFSVNVCRQWEEAFFASKNCFHQKDSTQVCHHIR
jgi:NAD dependent epimerase/dehydratase family enzyme